MRSELKRLATMAKRLQLCHIHYTRLVCVTCDVEWRGTDAEFWELGVLMTRLEPYDAESPRASGYDCPTTRHPLYCLTCNDVGAMPPQMPADAFTETEIERYAELLALMHVKPGP